jgi:hypothetical protein
MRIPALALIGLAAVMIVLALWTVGGPEQARAERRDQVRMNDLQNLAHHLMCLRRLGLGVDEQSDACPEGARRTDPLSGEPYPVEAVSGDVVRLCADFETRLPGQWWADRDDFNPSTGCLVATMREARPW